MEGVHNPRFARVIQAQYKKVTSAIGNSIKVVMCPQNVSTWYVLLKDITGLKSEFQDGEYILSISIPENYPLNMPTITFLSENGVYKIGQSICMDAHRTTDITQLIMIIISNLISWESLPSSPEITNTTIEHKRQLAKLSRQQNERLTQHSLLL